jgi:hypothetical protein
MRCTASSPCNEPHRWHPRRGMEIEEMCREYDRSEYWLRGFATYLAHPRHCGFPSPLLDWSNSPYVAAHFAFARAKHDGKAAIFTYRERPSSSFKISGGDTPQIISVRPNVKTHRAATSTFDD